MTACFRLDDLQLFGAASHDRNPLHLSPTYARRSQFGQQVVYGVLGALALLSRTPVPADRRLARATFDFSRPIFTDTDYRIGDGALRDGSTMLVKTALSFEDGDAATGSFSGGAVRDAAAALSEDDLIPGLTRTGAYAPDPSALQALCERWNLDQNRWGSLPITALLWSSYFAGMEMPGERALFYRLSIRLAGARPVRGPLQWSARLVSRNALNHLRIDFELSMDGEPAASGEIGVLLRPAPLNATNAEFARSDQLAGKVALVTGGSRGLGASIARALALRGARVLVNFQSTRAEAERLRDELPAGLIQLLQGNAADADWCRSAAQEIPALDYLVLNAFPTALPMRAEADTADRIASYASKAWTLTATPLSVFADRVKGATILVSSAYVETSPKEFPHYVAAKAAGEAMLRSVARQHRKAGYVILRPEKLLTDMTNTAFGAGDALPTAMVAARLADRLCEPFEPGAVELIRIP
jgi:NAD(P)-dependent dehydrogenase (short-subunit alcohol dehydrogenase family)